MLQSSNHLKVVKHGYELTKLQRSLRSPGLNQIQHLYIMLEVVKSQNNVNVDKQF